MYLQKLGANETTDYSLWRATRKLKWPYITVPPLWIDEGNYARSEQEKATIFAKYFKDALTQKRLMKMICNNKNSPILTS